MSLRWCRWLLPAALATAGGVALAVWSHGGDQLSSFASPPTVKSAPTLPVPSPSPATTPTAESVTAQRSAPRTLETPEQLERLRRDLVAGLDGNLDSTLRALLGLDRRRLTYLADDVIRRAAERAPQRTLQWLESNVADTGLREQLLTAAYTGLVRDDPTFAMNLAQTLTDPDARRVASHRVLEAWATEDVVAAYEWVRGQQGEWADELQVMVMEAYIGKAPRQAGELIAGMPPGGARDRLMDRYAYTLAESDAAAATDWVAQFPGGVARQHAMSSIFDRWAQQDHWAAIDYAAQHVDGELSYELIGRVAAEMGASRPEALSRELHRVPEAYQPLAALRLAGAWAAAQPDAARRWVAGLPAGAIQDSAQRGLSGAGRSSAVIPDPGHQ